MIGQVFQTYWLAQFEDKFYIIDQNAAHEKIYYERLVRKFREHSIDSQYLTPPLIVSLNMQEEEVLNANRDYFEKFGFDEVFGRSAVMELLELKGSGASKLLSNLVKADIIEPVSGHGKGKYKFKK